MRPMKITPLPAPNRNYLNALETLATSSNSLVPIPSITSKNLPYLLHERIKNLKTIFFVENIK